MLIRIIVACVIFTLSFTAEAEKVTLTAKDGFKLSANYTAANDNLNSAVLMLHQCNADKNMYSGLARSLSAKGISSLALDFRAYGESVTDKISRKVIRENATSREDYFSKFGEIRKLWPSDVETALKFLRGKVGNKNISYIGASCGGGQAVNLAQRHKPASFIIFSSGMNEEYTSLFNKVSNVPALIIAAQGDEFTFKSSNKIFRQAKSPDTRLLTYKGKGHGFPLFEQDSKLEETMVEWFEQFTE